MLYFFSSSHVFPVVEYGCESWTIKKVGRRRIDAFKLWCWRRLLSVLWTARRSNQSVNPKWNQLWISIGRTDAEASIQYFGHLMQRVDTLEKTLMLGKIENRRKGGWQRRRWFHVITVSMDMSLSELVMDRKAWHAAVRGVTKSWTWLSKWTILIFHFMCICIWIWCFPGGSKKSALYVYIFTSSLSVHLWIDT